jgi:hypothetical protein
VNRSAEEVALVPPGVVTITLTVPSDSAGAEAFIVAEFTTLTELDAVVPNTTVAPETNPDPLMVTTSPPANGPLEGATPVMVGTGR